MKKADSYTRNFDLCFKFYEKAVEGRNLHYQNDNTWAHYYAIFTGALFISFYTIGVKISDIYSLLIVIAGLITAICWHLTVKGHYHWMLSWIKIVHTYENELARISKNNHQKEYRVYSVYFETDEDKYQQNISTQKLTSLFTLFIDFAWSILTVIKTEQFFMKTLPYFFLFFILLFGFCFIAVILINVVLTLYLSNKSDVKKMKHNIIMNMFCQK